LVGRIIVGSVMSDSYIIEVQSKAAGIVVREKGGFRFFSASEDFNRMDGQYFRSARDAEREAIAYVKQGKSAG
jgi:hypothetical protein